MACIRCEQQSNDLLDLENNTILLRKLRNEDPEKYDGFSGV